LAAEADRARLLRRRALVVAAVEVGEPHRGAGGHVCLQAPAAAVLPEAVGGVAQPPHEAVLLAEAAVAGGAGACHGGRGLGLRRVGEGPGDVLTRIDRLGGRHDRSGDGGEDQAAERESGAARSPASRRCREGTRAPCVEAPRSRAAGSDPAMEADDAGRCQPHVSEALRWVSMPAEGPKVTWAGPATTCGPPVPALPPTRGALDRPAAGTGVRPDGTRRRSRAGSLRRVDESASPDG
jgi:hypothetical protein